MPIASGLGFVEREIPPRAVIRAASAECGTPDPPYAASHPERLVCGLLIAGVVGGSLTTLLWFVITF